jgi:alpha-tubulin suppressor-like RCC1 family protein
LPSVALGSGRTSRQISAGYGDSCALLDDFSVKCWGINAYGELGQADSMARGEGPNQLGDALPPVQLGTAAPQAVIAGEATTCAVLNDGSAKCWGSGLDGRLGQGSQDNLGDAPNEMGEALRAIDVGTGRKVIQLAVGDAHACALLDNGAVKCWGNNSNGELGLGDRENRGDDAGEMGDNLPSVDLGTGLTVKSLIAGSAQTCALFQDGSLKCWGYSAALGLGDDNNRGDEPGEMGDNLPFVDLGTGHTARLVAIGDGETCAVLDDSSLKCWGENSYGGLGLGDVRARGQKPNEMGDNLPTVDLGIGRGVRSIAIGSQHACAVLDNATLKCWGRNDFGQLGLGDTNFRGDGPGEMGDQLPAVPLVDN